MRAGRCCAEGRIVYRKEGERVEAGYTDKVEETAKAIIRILADNGFSIQEAEEVLEATKYTIRQQKVAGG